jgi:hypothetical protein
MSKIGVDTKDAFIDILGDEYGRTVSVSSRLGGLRSPMSASVSFGGQARIESASGQVAAPVSAAKYDRVDTTKALIQQADNYLFGGRGGVVAADATIGGGAAVAPAIAPVGASEPVTSVPTVTTVDVAITKVAASLTTVTDVDGTVWLIPAYDFTSEAGDQFTVPAIDTAFLQPVAVPAVGKVVPPEPGGVEGTPGFVTTTALAATTAVPAPASKG